MNLRQKLEQYRPYNEQEDADRSVMLSLLAREEDILTRENSTDRKSVV